MTCSCTWTSVRLDPITDPGAIQLESDVQVMQSRDHTCGEHGDATAFWRDLQQRRAVLLLGDDA